ncbi:hypothetical protein JL721_8188 [Aureococcus anophagefferens]|nr:hypothetical protein JL721_8188 [Aureococcus anophagefferens]
MPNLVRVAAPVAPLAPAGDEPLVADCALPNATFADSPLDSFLLKVTRDFYAEETPGPAYRSARRGILGLMDEMRVLMFDEAGDAAAQTETVRLVLLDLMTPVLPPFYRLFMGGFVPSAARGDPAWLVDAFAKVPALGKPGERVFGLQKPPIYAPLLTSVVAPLVFGFLVGPGSVNRRADGELGGLVVEKCKFLQESNCKGLCLNQCKRPAELLFDDLGVPLHVVPTRDPGVPVVLGRTRAEVMSWQEKKLEYENRMARARGQKLDTLKTCTICGADKAKACKGCGTTAYCSTDCQRIDWRDRGHRKVCKEIASRAEAPTPPPSPPRDVFYGPAPRSHADEIRARIAAEHEAARVRREANPERSRSRRGTGRGARSVSRTGT